MNHHEAERDFYHERFKNTFHETDRDMIDIYKNELTPLFVAAGNHRKFHCVARNCIPLIEQFELAIL
jgi:hypothetical protein